MTAGVGTALQLVPLKFTANGSLVPVEFGELTAQISLSAIATVPEKDALLNCDHLETGRRGRRRGLHRQCRRAEERRDSRGSCPGPSSAGIDVGFSFSGSSACPPC